jgi:hypothetical protein
VAAQRKDLPLLARRSLVPFVEITEAVQTLILADELHTLQLSVGRAQRSTPSWPPEGVSPS